MKIVITAERSAEETRVAASPFTVQKYVGLGFDVVVEKDAGLKADFTNDAYKDAGATIETGLKKLVKDADILLSVLRPSKEELIDLPDSAIVVAMLDPYAGEDELADLKNSGKTSFAMELMPRISRAQSMDVLSSQSNLAGYKSILEAASEFGRAFPMMMTAAGTIAPARVFVMGVGVAGLQAIATARRLGAIVTATDVRMATKEQVESLGAEFVMVEPDAEDSGETAGGYAKEMSDDYKKRQAELVASHIKKQDIVVTTALIPGRPAPQLISKDMIESMGQGSIIVDLATSRGGNTPLSVKDKVIVHKGVKIIGYANLAGRLAQDASNLYARNLMTFVTLLLSEDKANLNINWEDEIITGTLLTKSGELVHAIYNKDENNE
ncbi:MAG: Re/Si-specific NAD(P)(+) transhydrogenase subunit alpha [Rhizobiales bacterium]|nr:Re/Si-specific NAD(P)(+) transhydrogenase subunit alpha [Hyphomicrobiales bacterium]NRB14196.1 Re/Si-specific NAD(P)(+) transhydrogenase subunit alpha [Hyphomicrobiales bacterium]